MVQGPFVAFIKALWPLFGAWGRLYQAKRL